MRDTIQQTLAALLTVEPDWNQVPRRFHRLLRRCLEKDPARRLRDIGDAMALVDEESTATAQASNRYPSVALWIIAIAASAFAAFMWWQSRGVSPETRWTGVRLGGSDVE